MEIKYNLTGTDRKALVKAVSNIIGKKCYNMVCKKDTETSTASGTHRSEERRVGKECRL